jgi:hypothetical protein
MRKVGIYLLYTFVSSQHLLFLKLAVDIDEMYPFLYIKFRCFCPIYVTPSKYKLRNLNKTISSYSKVGMMHKIYIILTSGAGIEAYLNLMYI